MLCVHTYSILYGPIVIFVIAADVAAHTCPWYDIIESMVPHTKLHCILHKKKNGVCAKKSFNFLKRCRMPLLVKGLFRIPIAICMLFCISICLLDN